MIFYDSKKKKENKEDEEREREREKNDNEEEKLKLDLEETKRYRGATSPPALIFLARPSRPEWNRPFFGHVEVANPLCWPAGTRD